MEISNLITGITENFTLTGTATLSWTGSIPSNSNLDMTIKMGYGNVQTAPEPISIMGTMTALGFGVLFQKSYLKKTKKG